MQPPLRCATFVNGTINDPTDVDVGWTAEIALPLEKLAFGEINVSVPPTEGQYWRIDFSRVEWHVKAVGDPLHYELDPTFPPSPANQPNNYIWSPIRYAIDMSNADRWGTYLLRPLFHVHPPSTLIALFSGVSNVQC
jgi:hypothetical protein